MDFTLLHLKENIVAIFLKKIYYNKKKNNHKFKKISDKDPTLELLPNFLMKTKKGK